MQRVILEVKDLVKSFSKNVVLDKINMEFKTGEVHALLGENGAGKSTLIKCISGAHAPDSGQILYDGKEYTHMDPMKAIEMGISVIYQEFNLVPSLSVAENIFLGHTLRNGVLIDRKAMNARAKEIFDDFGLSIDPGQPVRDLTVAYMQLVEIAKAVSHKSKVIVMDEPTAPLTSSETGILMDLIRKLKAQGILIIFISHRMEEIFEISDRVSVMRDGQKVATLETKETNRAELIEYMVGRTLEETFPPRTTVSGRVAMELKHVTGNGDTDISFSVHEGEILGLAGLVGAGRTELAQVIFGAAPLESGQIELFGEPVAIKSPSDAIAHHIGLIPEDRKSQGLLQQFQIGWNMTLPIIRRLSSKSLISRSREKQVIDEYFSALSIKATGASQRVRFLSGGNQQKVVVAKWLATESKVLIFDEPTRGIDVMTKQEIYRLMRSLTEQGLAVIMISSDMEELLGMSDRLVVMCEGRKSGELEKGEFSQTRVLSMAMDKEAAG